MKKYKKRIVWLDTTKGIAIITVLIGHMSTGEQLRRYIYSFHMPLFFMISGVLLYYTGLYKKRTIKESILKLTPNLLYPYIMFSIIATVYVISVHVVKGREAFASPITMRFWQLLFSGKVNSTIRILIQCICDTISFSGIKVLWFLPTLFVGEILVITILKKCDSDKSIGVAVMAVLIFLVPLLIVKHFYLTNSRWSKQITVAFLIYVVLIIIREIIAATFILIGFYLAKIDLFNKLNMMHGALFLVVDAIMSQFNGVDIWTGTIGNILLFYFNALVGSLAVVVFSKELLENIKILEYMGKNSLVIFATHQFGVILIANMLSTKISSNKIMAVILSDILLIIIELVIVQIFNRWFKFVYNYKDAKELISRCKC
ncbi:acyltransferase family protein [Lactobacillus delbrueckii subsp. bulgaricus]|nr:hypothetical protein [Lactobacillus delbrueckii subsp. bulgaricus]MBT8851551.1 hypothetical protein [Lactobacillus delbrueckii subsp. bulgaricus]